MLPKHVLPVNKKSALFQKQVIFISTNKQIQKKPLPKPKHFFIASFKKIQIST